MTPVLLAGFCTVMTLVAAGKLLVGSDRDCVDVGVLSVVAGITVLTLFWAGVNASATLVGPILLVALVGVSAIGFGLFLVNEHW